MNHLRLDIEGYYRRRERLFQDRWAMDRPAYEEELARLNATIYGYELLLCRHFRDSLAGIFCADEAPAG